MILHCCNTAKFGIGRGMAASHQSTAVIGTCINHSFNLYTPEFREVKQSVYNDRRLVS